MMKTPFFLLYSSTFLSLTCASNKNGYEVWASDQSNSLSGQSSLGVRGSFLWIYDSTDIENQLDGNSDAPPLSCTPNDAVGPCDLMDIFPPDLQDSQGNELSTIDVFGRLHGVIGDPQNLYVVANMFTPAGGFVGVIDVETKEAIGLFRVTEFTYDVSSGTSTTRSVHMSYWDEKDGDYILIDNLLGKAIERINVERNSKGKITKLQFDKSATIGLGRNMVVATEAEAFSGNNAFGNALMGSVVGDYADADLSDLTPAGACKEDGCASPPVTTLMGGRPNNVPICPIVSTGQNVYITFGGGGMFVADITQTPMKIIAEYGNNVVYGAGCGGVETDGKMFMDSGVSASGAGSDQSMFAIWAFDDDAMGATVAQNTPMPEVVFEDPNNTMTGGNTNGSGGASNGSGQLPGVTTRRDSHGMDITIDGKYLHAVDRIQNVVEVFDTETYERFTYDLTLPAETGDTPACEAKSVSDDANLPSNDPAPDLISMTPDGKYLMMALRGPAPVSVGHSGQGSCPGVGVVELTDGGRYGRLVDVIRTTNLVADSVASASIAPNGVQYEGAERSDIHGTFVVPKNKKPGFFDFLLWPFEFIWSILKAIFGFFF